MTCESTKCNVGKIDRQIRIVVGLTLVAVGLAMHSWWGFVGFLPLITGLVHWCPAYSFFKISTKNTEGDDSCTKCGS